MTYKSKVTGIQDSYCQELYCGKSVPGVGLGFGFILLSMFGLAIIGMGVFGCGRYAPVIAPELTAPDVIKFQPFVPSSKGVSLTWLAPQQDRQGKKLKKLDGFRIYRRDIPMNRQDRDNDAIEFKVIGVVGDTTVAERIRRQKDQRAILKSGRQVRLSQEDLAVSFLDTNVKAGGFYLYKVMAFNSLAAEGLATSFVEVLYNGEKSVSRTLYNEEDAGKLLAEVTVPEATPGADAAGTGSSVNSLGVGYR
jgi:hypothetical protein